MTAQGPVKKQQPDGPHANGDTARHVVDDQDAEGSGQQRPQNDPRNNQHNPQCANYRAPLMRKRHHQEHRPERPTERSDPTQHAKGRPGDCPGPRIETRTRRNVTQGEGGVAEVWRDLQMGWGWGLRAVPMPPASI